MEQMYLIEIFVDKVVVFTSNENESTADKNLIIKINFGPSVQFIFREGQLSANDEKKDDVIEVTENFRKQWSRKIRVGKSYLFPSYPDSVIEMLSKFPLEIAIWNDDESENISDQIYIGIGTMNWHTAFYHYLQESEDAGRLHEPLTIKAIVTLYQECCCAQAGEINFILRLSALGSTIITEYQQHDPERFCFRTDKASSMFECKRIEGDDPNFCMIGTLYESATLEDPDVVQNAQKKIEICTEMENCGIAGGEASVCAHDTDGGKSPKKYPISKIRMGDITGPCGNSTCPLAQKVKAFIRNLDAYKVKAAAITEQKPEDPTKKICGSCICKDERWHREGCPEAQEKPEKVKCSGCGGMAKAGDTCEDKKNKHYDTGATPSGTSPKSSNINFVTKVPEYKDAIFRRDYIVEDCFTATYICERPRGIGSKVATAACSITSKEQPSKNICEATTNKAISHVSENINPWVHNAEVSRQQPITVYNVTTIEDDCKCNPPKPSPPCKAFDCNCIAETSNIASRKQHRPYCPLYKHKSTCPVTMKNVEEGEKKEDDEDEAEPLPYGLPPIQLGPCPVMGRPCSVPDGFARMYKNAVLPTRPPSYSDAGKVCCSKEYEKIKKAVKEYMKNQKDHDMRCINQFNVDTERRCCDKEQVLRSLMGRECCGAHKLAIQEKFKEDKP